MSAPQPEANVLHLGSTPARTVLKLAWPTILEQIAFTLLQFADTAMVGALGADCTAAIGIAAPLTWLIGGLTAAVGVGFSVQVAQRIGAGEYAAAEDVIRQVFLLSLLLGGLLTGLCLLAAPVFPALMGAEPQVIPHAAAYLSAISFSALVNMLEVSVSSVLRCMGNTRAPMAANLTAILANIVLNYLLIFPPHTVTLGSAVLAVPGMNMGVAGAAWGTVIAIGISAALVLTAVLSPKSALRLRLHGGLRFTAPVLQRAARIGLPVVLERAATSIGQILFLRLVATMGTVAVASHHLAVSAESISYLPAFGFSVAATTLVGQAVGAGLPEESRRFGNISARMGLICMTASGVVLFLLAGPLISLFSPDPAVISLGRDLLRIVAFAQPMQAWAIVYSGALRGAGNSRWAFYISLLGVWGVRLGLSALSVLVFGAGLRTAWVVMVLDLTFRGVVSRRYWNRAGYSGAPDPSERFGTE